MNGMTAVPEAPVVAGLLSMVAILTGLPEQVEHRRAAAAGLDSRPWIRSPAESSAVTVR